MPVARHAPKTPPRKKGANELSGFAYVDKDGKGHLPLKKNGKLDPGHVRNARARWGQTHFDSPSAKAKALAKIKAAEKTLGIGQENKDAHEADSPYPEHAPKFATHAVAVSATAISDAAGDANGAPEWIMVIPAGQFSGRDGRGPFKLTDPNKVLEATAKTDMKAGLPLDYDHATDFAAPHGGRAPAAGWMKDLQVRDGAIWAHVEWTDKGREAVASKEYRYISPVFSFDEKTGEVLALLRAGLTNNPNLYDTAICARLVTMNEQEKRRQALVIEGIAVNLRRKKKSLQAEGGDDSSIVGKLRAAIKEACEQIGLDPDVVMKAISKGLGGDLEDPDNDGMLEDDSTPPADDGTSPEDDEADDMEARMADMGYGDDDAFSKLADECRMAAETAEKDGKAEKAARFRKIEKHARARCTRREPHAWKVINSMNHLEMAEHCERMAKDHEEAGRPEDAEACMEMARHHREKNEEEMRANEEEMRAKHRQEVAAAASAEVKTVKTDVDAKIATLTQQLDTANGKLAAMADRELKNLATQKVEAAIADGKLPPAQREWAINACIKSPEDFAEFLKNAPKLPAGIENFEPERKVGDVVVSAQEVVIAGNMGITVEQYATMREKTAKGQGLAMMVASL
jgi:phage I-like protein